MFDEFLRDARDETGEPFAEFTDTDYIKYVDGRPRYDGVRQFLHVAGDRGRRSLVRKPGRPQEHPRPAPHRVSTAWSSEGSVRFVRLARERGLRTAVVSSSANTPGDPARRSDRGPLRGRVDGVVAEQEGLPGKPRPGHVPGRRGRWASEREQAAVFEDALAGVEAGRAGNFGGSSA